MNQNHNIHRLQEILEQARNDIDQGRLADAESRYRMATQIVPDDPQLRLTLGLLYLEQHRFDAAQVEIERSIRLNPDNPNAHRSMGDLFYARRQFDPAIAAYRKACDMDPEHLQARLGLGNALQESSRYEEALACFQEVLLLRPGYRRALNNIGKTFYDLGLVDKALEYYDRALESDPDYAEAHFNRSVARLALGDYENGWKEYEWRFKRKSAASVYPYSLPSPRWQGQPYQGQRLLVHAEQGYGDVLQFARYLPMVKQLGGHLILQAHPPLMPLLQNLTWVDELIPFDLHIPPAIKHDLHIPLLSLPLIFGTVGDTIPTKFPYLSPDPARCRYWETHPWGAGLRVGIVWAASPLNPKRNYPISQAKAWFDIPGISFYSLQIGPSAGQIREFAHFTDDRMLGEKLVDFGETAALIANLDLVISVDTAVAHLAGAMGKPLWVLLPCIPDWRWPSFLTDSPWYPDVRLYRQQTLDTWDKVEADVAGDLQTWQREQTRDKNILPGSSSESARFQNETMGTGRPVHPGGAKIKKILFVSPLYGGSLEVVRYLCAGFQQAGRTTRLLDNSRYYGQFRQINEAPEDDPKKNELMGRMLQSLDRQLLKTADEFKPDLVMAIAQSPLDNHTVRKLQSQGIVCAYWFVEDYRFRDYWSDIAPAYDFFFMIQRDDHLKAEFQKMGYANWHYLPLACEPGLHKPWSAAAESRQAYQCQVGFMGAPYLNRLHIFDKLTDYDLKIWGEGWRDAKMSQALRSCIQGGVNRVGPEASVKIYSSADIVVNLHSSPFVEGISAEGDFVNPRTFEVAGCAGFQLTDYRKELPLLFEPGKEIVLFHNLEELDALIKYWLPRDGERKKISANARARAYGQHTYRHRAGAILRTIETC